jgi:hypothetical protein
MDKKEIKRFRLKGEIDIALLVSNYVPWLRPLALLRSQVTYDSGAEREK